MKRILVTKQYLMGKKDDEGAMLQEMFEKFTTQLELRKQESKLYLEQLECEHQQQKQLAFELQKTMSSLNLMLRKELNIYRKH